MKKGKTSMDIIEILKKIESNEDFECGEGLDDAGIQSLEKELGMSFPDSYKVFLKKYGYMSWFGDTLCGYSSDNFSNVIYANKKLRARELPEDFFPYPEDAFLIKRYAGGGDYMLFEKGSERSGQVGLFLDETFNQEVETWDSFESFLKDIALDIQE